MSRKRPAESREAVQKVNGPPIKPAQPLERFQVAVAGLARVPPRSLATSATDNRYTADGTALVVSAGMNVPSVPRSESVCTKILAR